MELLEKIVKGCYCLPLLQIASLQMFHRVLSALLHMNELMNSTLQGRIQNSVQKLRQKCFEKTVKGRVSSRWIPLQSQIQKCQINMLNVVRNRSKLTLKTSKECYLISL